MQILHLATDASANLDDRMLAKTIVHHIDGWPIVVSKIYGDKHTDQTLDEAYAAWTEFMHRGPHVLILDMTEGTAGATAAQRAKVATWLEANDELLRSKRQLAHILVFNSAIVRGIVTAVFWLRPPANPHFAAANLDDAVNIAIARLRAERIPVSAESIGYARRAVSRERIGPGNSPTTGR
jgi:hypothetical protein